MTIGGLQSHRNNPVSLMPLDDPEDLSLAQQKLRDREPSTKERNSGSASISYGNSPQALVNRLELTSKMGKHWLESNMAAIASNQPSTPTPGSGSTGSALLDTYLQLIAEHSSNMAAAAAAAAAAASAQSASNNNHADPHSGSNSADNHHQESIVAMDTSFNDKHSPKTTAAD